MKPVYVNNRQAIYNYVIRVFIFSTCLFDIVMHLSNEQQVIHATIIDILVQHSVAQGYIATSPLVDWYATYILVVQRRARHRAIGKWAHQSACPATREGPLRSLYMRRQPLVDSRSYG